MMDVELFMESFGIVVCNKLGFPLVIVFCEEFDKLIGLEKMKAFHLNDSKKEFASRKDRHEHIGQGHMGLTPFRFLINDPRFEGVPMYLETAKGEADGQYEGMSWDAANLKVLRGLIER